MTKNERTKRKTSATRRPPKASADLNNEIATLKRELAEAQQRETATADVLKAISRSAFDLQTVLDTLVQSAARLCKADSAWLFRRDGELYRVVANHSFSREFEEYMKQHPLPVGRDRSRGELR
jgi:two-component system NtrC family sensor kinase